jgi:hypothetical protein
MFIECGAEGFTDALADQAEQEGGGFIVWAHGGCP